MKESIKIQLKLINIGIAEDNIGKSKLLSDCADVCNTSLVDGLSYEECERGLQMVVTNHMKENREETSSIMGSIMDGDFEGKLGLFEYEWGEDFFTADTMHIVCMEQEMWKSGLFEKWITQEQYDTASDGMKLFRLDLKESDLEDMTRKELELVSEETNLAFEKRWALYKENDKISV